MTTDNDTTIPQTYTDAEILALSRDEFEQWISSIRAQFKTEAQYNMDDVRREAYELIRNEVRRVAEKQADLESQINCWIEDRQGGA